MLLEKEFVTSMLFVSLEEDNFDTYSSAYLKLILEIGSETDNVFKEICGLQGKTTIRDYVGPVLERYPGIVNQTILVNDSDIQLKPFDGWNPNHQNRRLVFWDKYNSIKHDRILNYKEASLETAITALGGLFVLLMYRINEIYKSDKDAMANYPGESKSELFTLENWKYRIRTDKIKSEFAVYDDSKGGKQII